MHDSKNSISAAHEIGSPLHKLTRWIQYQVWDNVDMSTCIIWHQHLVKINGGMTIFQLFAGADCTLSVTKFGTTCAEH